MSPAPAGNRRQGLAPAGINQHNQRLLSKVIKVVTDTFRGPDEYNSHEISWMFFNNRFRILLLLENGMIRGIIVLNTSNRNFLHLEYLVVCEQARGKGYGSLLLESLISKLKYENQYQILTLECEKTLIPFYRRSRFIECQTSTNRWKIFRNGGIQKIKYYIMFYRFSASPISNQQLQKYVFSINKN